MRKEMLKKLREKKLDVLIVGGGINGAVSLAAIAARGLSVALVERGDFASQTSQESSYLVWGGIKYLENFEFGLVHGLCKSRNKLMSSYPSSVREIRFFCPHKKGTKHGLIKLYLGSWFYWLMGHFFTKKPRYLTKKTIINEEPLVNAAGINGGFEYSDSFLPDLDARFVFNFIKQATHFGAVPVNYTELVSAHRTPQGMWRAEIRDLQTNESFFIEAKTLINTTGPQVDQLNKINHIHTRSRHLLSKGIHLIVPRLTREDKVLTFMADDNRMFFIIPLGPVSCVGTTDTRVESFPTSVTAEDRAFVLSQINSRLTLKKPLTEADIISERCGVRPLAITATHTENGERDFLSLSRKHIIECNNSEHHISVFGGKLTDCLNIGKEIVDELKKLGHFIKPEPTDWFGEPMEMRQDFLRLIAELPLDATSQSTEEEKPSKRLWRRYGIEAFEIIKKIRDNPASGEILFLGIEMLRAELEYMRDKEFVVTLEDFLRRRTYLSLIHKHSDLEKMPALKEACRILFGEKHEEKWLTYFTQNETLEQKAI